MTNTNKNESIWIQDYISEIPPIVMRDPFLELLGQIKGPIPYYYEEVVKLSGHSCGTVAGGWIITKKALEALYPNSVPVRGQIKIIAPGAEDEGVIGVFAEVITFITGAAPKSGFTGGGFGEAYRRRDLLQFDEDPTDSGWVFERIDTKEKVSVKYIAAKIQPPSTPEFSALGGKVARGQATPEETAAWIEHWNARANYVLNNADSLISVEKI